MAQNDVFNSIPWDLGNSTISMLLGNWINQGLNESVSTTN